MRRPVIQGAYVAVWHGERVLVIQNSYRQAACRFPPAAARAASRCSTRRVRELREEVGIRAQREQLAYYGEIVHRTSYAEDHAHVFELRCASAPEVRVDAREVIWAEFLAPDDALARGVVGVVRRYLEDNQGRPSEDRRLVRWPPGVASRPRAPPPPPPRTTPPRASSAGSPSAGARG